MDNLELYSFQKLSPRKSIASYDKRSSKKVNRNVGKFDKGMALESNLGQKLKDNLAEFKINFSVMIIHQVKMIAMMENIKTKSIINIFSIIYITKIKKNQKSIRVLIPFTA